MTKPGQFRGQAPAAGGIDADAFAAEFKAAAAVLWTLAAAVLGRSTAVDDVLQEAAVIGLQKRDQFTPGTSFTAWLGRIVRFVAQNHRRRERRRRTEATDPAVIGETVAGRAAEAAPAIDARGELLQDMGAFDDALRGALLQLRPVARACLLLKVVIELDYDAIAAVLRIPAGTAMSHVHRARALLAAELRPQETPR